MIPGIKLERLTKLAPQPNLNVVSAAGFAAAFSGAFFAVPAHADEDEGGLPPALEFIVENEYIDAENPDFVATVRAGVAVSPAYLGSSEYELGPSAALRLDYVRFPGGFEYGSGDAVGFRRGLGLRGSVGYIGKRDSDDYEEIEGLDDIDRAFEAGFGIGYEQRNYRVFADVRYGFIGHHAWVGDVGADAIAYPIEGLTLTLGPRISLGDARFADEYFGVSEEESARSGIEAYDAEGGVLGAGVLLEARYQFNERWGLEGSAEYTRLMNDAAESPIAESGSEDQYEFRFSLTRRISLDF